LGRLYLYKMKKIITALAFFLFANAAIAQKDLLALNERNKYIYYRVDTAAGITADTLQARSVRFLAMVSPKIKLRSAAHSGTAAGEGKFITYGSGSLVRHVNGEVSYLVNIECKDQKFRFWITDLTFTPYQRDRYGNFVPRLGIAYPLEGLAGKLDKGETNMVLVQTGAFCRQMGDKLKLYMTSSFTPKKEEKLKKVVTDKW
jgi:hypothetical protein